MAATRGCESQLTVTACLPCFDWGAHAPRVQVSAPSPKCPGLGSTRMKLPKSAIARRDRQHAKARALPEAMRNKRGLQLERVVLLGRTFEEYRRYFLLEPRELIRKRVLDVAGGVSSFCSEANNLGIKVTAFDPIYSLSREKIRKRSDPDLESVYRSIGLVPTYRWGFTKILTTCGHCGNAHPLFFSRISKPIQSVKWRESSLDCLSPTASSI
jgi:hypothetical protein